MKKTLIVVGFLVFAFMAYCTLHYLFDDTESKYQKTLADVEEKRGIIQANIEVIDDLKVDLTKAYSDLADISNKEPEVKTIIETIVKEGKPVKIEIEYVTKAQYDGLKAEFVKKFKFLQKTTNKLIATYEYNAAIQTGMVERVLFAAKGLSKSLVRSRKIWGVWAFAGYEQELLPEQRGRWVVTLLAGFMKRIL